MEERSKMVLNKETLDAIALLTQSIEYLELPPGVFNALWRWRCCTILDVLIEQSEGSLRQIRGIGPKGLSEITRALDRYLNENGIVIEAGR